MAVRVTRSRRGSEEHKDGDVVGVGVGAGGAGKAGDESKVGGAPARELMEVERIPVLTDVSVQVVDAWLRRVKSYRMRLEEKELSLPHLRDLMSPSIQRRMAGFVATFQDVARVSSGDRKELPDLDALTKPDSKASAEEVSKQRTLWDELVMGTLEWLVGENKRSQAQLATADEIAAQVRRCGIR